MNLKANTKNFRFKKVWNSDGDGLTNAMSELYIFIQILIMKGVWLDKKILWWCSLRNKESFLEYYEVTKYGWWIQYIWISDSCKRTAEAKHGKDKLKQEEDWKKGFEFKLEHNLLCKYIFTEMD